ncbi:MAG: LPP20 family lipoprotein [Motiliproteus sp.]
MSSMFVVRWLTLGAVVMLSGCDTLGYYYSQIESKQQPSYQRVLEVEQQPRIVTATGYAPISLQPGQTQDQKVLMAMRASKLQAYQELAAIVHGQQLFGTSQVREMVMQNDQFNAAVGGVIRGARVVKTYPVQRDAYATILELDLRDVQRAYIDMQ